MHPQTGCLNHPPWTGPTHLDVSYSFRQEPTPTLSRALVAEEGLLCAGAVSFAVLNFYINAMGGKLKFGLLMSWFLLVEAARVGATVWLSHWTDTVDAPGGAPHGPLWFLMIYTIISAVQVGFLRLSTSCACMTGSVFRCLVRILM